MTFQSEGTTLTREELYDRVRLQTVRLTRRSYLVVMQGLPVRTKSPRGSEFHFQWLKPAQLSKPMPLHAFGIGAVCAAGQLIGRPGKSIATRDNRISHSIQRAPK